MIYIILIATLVAVVKSQNCTNETNTFCETTNSNLYSMCSNITGACVTRMCSSDSDCETDSILKKFFGPGYYCDYQDDHLICNNECNITADCSGTATCGGQNGDICQVPCTTLDDCIGEQFCDYGICIEPCVDAACEVKYGAPAVCNEWNGYCEAAPDCWNSPDTHGCEGDYTCNYGYRFQTQPQWAQCEWVPCENSNDCVYFPDTPFCDLVLYCAPNCTTFGETYCFDALGNEQLLCVAESGMCEWPNCINTPGYCDEVSDYNYAGYPLVCSDFNGGCYFGNCTNDYQCQVRIGYDYNLSWAVNNETYPYAYCNDNYWCETYTLNPTQYPSVNPSVNPSVSPTEGIDICNVTDDTSKCHGKANKCNKDKGRSDSQYVSKIGDNGNEDDWCAWCLCDAQTDDDHPFENCAYYWLNATDTKESWATALFAEIFQSYFMETCFPNSQCKWKDIVVTEPVTGCDCGQFECDESGVETYNVLGVITFVLTMFTWM